jgi:hypothetical protein
VAWSALMDWPREQRVQAALEAIRLIATSSENGWKKWLLADCVQAYAPLDDSQRMELNTLLDEPRRGLRTMIKAFTEEAEERGQQRALESMRNFLSGLLEERFGGLPQPVQQKLATLSMDQIKSLIKDLIEGKSLHELRLEESINGTSP